MLSPFASKAQLLFDMGSYRNLLYTSGGYNGAFSNITIGAARRDFFRLAKKEVIGILDISIPLSNRFFTKQVIKKGFQFDVCKYGYFRLPLTFASSSIIRHDSWVHYHDITAELTLNPGIYTARYTLALDCRSELIVFRRIKYSPLYKHDVNSKAVNHWSEPGFDIFKFGIIGGLNFRRLAVYVKTGYERNPMPLKNYIPGYIVAGLGFKCGTKPMKEKSKASATQ